MDEVSAAELDRLCETYGIATRYEDFFQHEHFVPDTTKRALLTAMGVSLVGAGAPALRMPEAVPQPLVFRLGGLPPAFDLAVAAPPRLDQIRWQVALESGGQCSGT